MTKSAVQLDDKYTQNEGQIYLSTLQALVRLPILQRRRDMAAGLNTAGFITGYRGSPVGTYDAALWSAQKLLDEYQIQFLPGVNEELAASTIKGTQWLDFYQQKNCDGVFALWYGKHLGVERAMESIKAANYSGTSKYGGALVLAGDDMGAKSSITAAESDPVFVAANVPLLYPATTQDYIEFGLYGWAMSRFSGCWVGLKGVTDTVELTSTISADSEHLKIIKPDDFLMPPEGVHAIKTDYMPLVQERRLIEFRLPAARAFARANRIDKVVLDSSRRSLGIVTAGKPYLDVMEALRELGITGDLASELGIRVYKLAMVWPLEEEGIREFCSHHKEILVVEEKSAIVEQQLRYQLYSWKGAERPEITGKEDETGAELVPLYGETSVSLAIDILIRRLRALGIEHPEVEARIAAIHERRSRIAQLPSVNVLRTAYFCSGCPHNTSTRTIDGSLTFTGVGCYGIVTLVMPDRNTEYAAQMGAEGTLWVGLNNYVDLEHSFQNLGDGTYFHSGILAIRSALASGANMTYKLLYNDAVAMTGGQPMDGELTVEMMANQVYWEGVRPVIVVTDEPDKYPANVSWPPGTTVRHRDEMETVQRELQLVKGVSAIIYDQTCAAEKRRRRKRGLFPDPPKRVFINQDVCEGCGDCSTQSNCMSVQPLDTEFGRKRRIDQSGCNKDFSCLSGFCPSFVSVHGGQLRKAEKSHGEEELERIFAGLPEPETTPLNEAYNILLTGIGGTGVLTVGAIIGMAAHLEYKTCKVMDITGMAQKGGAVLSHIRIGPSPDSISALRLWGGSVDLLLGCDLVVSVGEQVTSLVRAEGGKAAVNSDVVPTAQFQRDQDVDFSRDSMLDILRQLVGDDNLADVAATQLATRLMGDSIATNIFMLGFALQKGFIPLGLDSIVTAIELNGVAVQSNLHTLAWGRMTAADPEAVRRFIDEATDSATVERPQSTTLDELIARRVELLSAYQNASYAKEYQQFVDTVRTAEQQLDGESEQLTTAVARYFSKLMAYKDEYEVARLYTTGDFERRLKQQFDGDYKLKFHLAPPIISPVNRKTGKPGKIEFGAWLFPALKILARMKSLRGTPLDFFGFSSERKRERQLISEYRDTIGKLLPRLNQNNHVQLVEIASLPELVKGYGYIKEENMKVYARELADKLEQFDKNGVGVFARVA
ncbi:MAG: indolepyruvate ferredoxin oxidoreductase family protein [Halieaceae bacterium]|nr:indolepyruvate ferredoxin oxidoreductase family protein [Halieaceae bacterium]